jgi:hypothetical protein
MDIAPTQLSSSIIKPLLSLILQSRRPVSSGKHTLFSQLQSKMSIPISHVPLSRDPSSRQRKTKETEMIVHANAPQPDEPEPEPAPAPQEERPFLLKKLQHGLGTRVLGDTLDWDGESVRFPRARARRRPWVPHPILVKI